MDEELLAFGSAAGISALNNFFGSMREGAARRENYDLNEKAAERADLRTRKLYFDLYSPKAQLQQLKNAGLSPSLFYGDGGGISGQAGAQGAGANISPNVFGLDPLTLSQIELNKAQASNLEATAENTNTDTKIKEIERDLKSLSYDLYKIDYDVLQGFAITNEGEGPNISLFEHAKEMGSYEDFSKWVIEKGGQKYASEQAQRTLRQIYKTTKEFDTDLSKLNFEKLDADFAASITKALINTDYAKLNAESAIEYLRKNVETDTLDADMKKAWNDLLKELEEKNPTYKDVAIILYNIVSTFLKRTNFNVGHRNTNVTGGTSNTTTHVLQN